MGKRLLDINISKARIEFIGISIPEGEDDKPRISVRLQLLTEDGRKITTYDVTTDDWNKDKKIDIPFNLYAPLGEVVRTLETLGVQNLNGIQRMLVDGNAKPKEKKTPTPKAPF